MNVAIAIFTYLKNLLVQCDTVSKKIKRRKQSAKGAGIIVDSENGISNNNSMVGISNNKTKLTLSTVSDGEQALLDALEFENINAERSFQRDSFDDLSLNMPRTAPKDLMEDVKIQLLVAMKNMNEENRKEMKVLHNENQKETNKMIEKIRKETISMNEDNRREIRSIFEDNRKQL